MNERKFEMYIAIIYSIILVSILPSAISRFREEFSKILYGYQLTRLPASLALNFSASIRHCAMYCLEHQPCKAANYLGPMEACELMTTEIDTTLVGIVANSNSNVILQTGYACGVKASLPPNVPNTQMDFTFRQNGVAVIFKCESMTSGTSVNHCPVSTCIGNNHDQWSSGYNISCTTEDCYTNSATYRGKMSCTVSGRTCQHWNTDTPHIKYYEPSDVIDRLTNYCRDPSDDGFPWCYTMDKDVRWEPCPVTKC